MLANDRQATRTLDNVASHSEKTGKRIGSSFGKLAGSIAGAFAGIKIVDVLRDSVNAASDLGESMSKTKAVFGAASKGVEVFASTAARSMGQSQQATLEATATFGNLFRALSIGVKPAASMSQRLVTLAGDLASFNNVSPEDALLALRSGILGEAEPLRKFGVSLSQTRIEAEALSSGLVKPVINMEKLRLAQARASLAQRRLTEATKKHGKTSKEAQSASIGLESATQAVRKAMGGQKVDLTAAQKAQAAYSIILKDTKLAQGDFARTSDGLANQQRILSAQFTDVKAKLGTQLLPVIVDLAHVTNDKVLPAFDRFVTGMQTGEGAGGQFADVVGGIGDGLETAWHVGKPFLSFIADHPKLFGEIAVGAGAFAAAMKVIGTVKKLPGLGSLMSKASPMPVFVTNPGFGTGVPGGRGPTGTPIVTGAGGGGATSRASRVLNSGPGALVVTIADVVLAPEAISSLKKLYGTTFDLSVNDAAKRFLAQLENIDTDKVTRRILQQHSDEVFAALIESTKTGETKGLQKALTDTYTDLAQHAAEVQKQIAKDTARNTANNVKLISGGFLTVADLAAKTSKKVATELTTGLGGGMARAKERADDLAHSIQGVPSPKIDPTSLKTAREESRLFLANLGLIPKSKVVDIRAQVTTSGKSLKLATLHTDGNVVYVQGRGGKQLLADGGWVLGPGSGTADRVPLMGSNGEFMMRQKVASKYPRQMEALNAGVPLEKVAGGSDGPITNYFDIRTADPVLAAHEALRRQRDRLFVSSQ